MTYDVNVELHDSLPVESRPDVDATALAALLGGVLADERIEEGAALTLLLAGDPLLHELNREHRDVDEPTDVLSFPADEGDPFPGGPDESRYLGDIAVSVPMVYRQATDAGLGPEQELHHVVLHGLLHLLGYDHETPDDDAVMRAHEEAVLGPEIHAGRTDEVHSDHR